MTGCINTISLSREIIFINHILKEQYLRKICGTWRIFCLCSLVFPYQPAFIPYASFAVLIRDTIVAMSDNLKLQNTLSHFLWENNKVLSIYCNMNMIKDKYSSFQALSSPKLFTCFPTLSAFVQDLITPQEIKDIKIRHFRRKKHNYKTLIIPGLVLLTQ